MRERYKDGQLIGAVSLPFEHIPDNYEIQPCINDQWDLSYAGIMKMMFKCYAEHKPLSKYDLCIEFQDESFYRCEVTEHQAMDFLKSSCLLRNAVNEQRDKNIVSHYLIPSAYCCRHAVELFIKYCILVKGTTTRKLNTHGIKKIWKLLDEKELPQYNALTSFIQELDTIDKNGTALRYGLTTEFKPVDENFQFNIDVMLSNSMYLINILTEHVIHKYRHKP